MQSAGRYESRELRLIEEIKGIVGSRYIGDDCAVLPVGMLATCDVLVEGTHFLRSLTSMVALGWKAAAVNLSDVAAMAGRPRYMLAALTLPESVTRHEVVQLYEGLAACAGTYRTAIVGGDLTVGPQLVVSVTVLADTHEAGVLKRSQAQPGDIVAVTGRFGAACAGLWALRQERSGYADCIEAHLRPKPRLGESWLLVETTGGRGALMDASDGLADALFQISRESAAGMEVDVGAVPVDRETRQAAEAASVPVSDWVLYGGEDYELVAAIPPDAWRQLAETGRNPFVRIGAVTGAAGEIVLTEGGRQLTMDLKKAFQHWD